jgi:maltose alpha-D-glucosyltransferase/alpha-amylase
VAAMKTRYHGDLHLGQVLVKQSDVVIIDFEGEPRHSMEERRRKHTPLKDVAGILRSFDYAAAAAARTVAELPALEVEDFQAFCNEWRALSVGAFMSAYRETIGDCPVWPENREGAADLLDLLVLDQAIYEVGYELANRPAWLSIPLKAVVKLLGGAESPKGAPRAIPRPTSTAWACSTAPIFTSMPTPGRGSSSTGTPWSSISGAARSPTT